MNSIKLHYKHITILEADRTYHAIFMEKDLYGLPNIVLALVPSNLLSLHLN